MPQQGLWHFRVHYEPYDVVDVINFIKDKAEMVIAVRETASRPHIHSVISEFKQTKSTFVQQFLKQFPNLNGNGSYSCSRKDDMEAQVRYCSKGESKETMPEILYCRNDIDWKGYHEQYWEENSLLKAKSKAEYQPNGSENVKQKAKSKTWTEKVYDEIKEIFPEHVRIIQQHQKSFQHTDYEIKTERESRIEIYCYFKQRLGPKKQSDFILRDMFTGIISGLIQEAECKEISKRYNTIEFNRIFTY